MYDKEFLMYMTHKLTLRFNFACIGLNRINSVEPFGLYGTMNCLKIRCLGRMLSIQQVNDGTGVVN